MSFYDYREDSIIYLFYFIIVDMLIFDFA